MQSSVETMRPGRTVALAMEGVKESDQRGEEELTELWELPGSSGEMPQG